MRTCVFVWLHVFVTVSRTVVDVVISRHDLSMSWPASLPYLAVSPYIQPSNMHVYMPCSAIKAVNRGFGPVCAVAGELETEVATELANEANDRLCCREVVAELPPGIVNALKGRDVSVTARLPFVDVLHLGATGAPETHPDDDVLTEAVFGNTKL